MSVFTFAGTGAADWPIHNDSFYKNYSVQRRERVEQRKFSCACYRSLLIDCGLGTFGLLNEVRQELSALTDVVITHSHPDHFDAAELSMLCEKLAPAKLTIWGAKELQPQLPSCANLSYRQVECFVPFTTGKLRITALPSNHWVADTDEQTVNYLIEDTQEDKTIFYGLDGAWLPIQSWRHLMHYKFDLFVLECTSGRDEMDMRAFIHNNTQMVRLLVGAIRHHKLLKPTGQIYVSHIAYTLHDSHEALQKELDVMGVKVAFDGLSIEI